jgi:hypothetical protein
MRSRLAATRCSRGDHHRLGCGDCAQDSGEIAHIVVARRWHLGQGAQHHLVEGGGQVGAARGQRWYRGTQVLLGEQGRARAEEGLLPAQQLVDQHPHGIDVGLRRDRLGPQLLG